MQGNLHITTPVYEGPLDLLLDLIEKRKLLINDISLASVTDEFLSRIQSMPEVPMRDTAEFVSLAATLLLIKSRSLLPLLELSGEEEQDIKQLEYRLAVYQIIKNAARELSRAKGGQLYAGEAPEFEALFVPDESVTQESLRAAATMLMEGFPTANLLPSVSVKKIISLEEMVERLAERVSSAFRLSFKEFSGLGKRGEVEKGEIIVGFLALLELVKQGIIRATQEGEFGDITLENDRVSAPTYE
jgi:segregation and condensation protein A